MVEMVDLVLQKAAFSYGLFLIAVQLAAVSFSISIKRPPDGQEAVDLSPDTSPGR